MVERTLPKPDTRVRFPSAAPKAPDFVAGLFPRLKRESLPGGNTFPRALGISTLQPVSRSKSPGPYGLGLYFLGWMWWLGWMGRGGMFLAPAGNPSSLRVGHPDVATEHTGLSPASLPLSMVRGRGRQGGEPRAARCGKSVRERGRGILGLGTADSSPRETDRYLGAGVVPQEGQSSFPRVHQGGACCSPTRARAAQLYLPEATSGCASSARAGAPVGAKEVYSVPTHPLHKRRKRIAYQARSSAIPS